VGLVRPRARWRLARGGVSPSSEAESRPRGRLALERGRDFVVRYLVLERDGDSPRGTTVVSLVDRCGFLGRGPFCFVRLLFIIFRNGHFPQLLEDPYGCSRHHRLWHRAKKRGPLGEMTTGHADEHEFNAKHGGVHVLVSGAACASTTAVGRLLLCGVPSGISVASSIRAHVRTSPHPPSLVACRPYMLIP
jgi:hypothetical protein